MKIGIRPVVAWAFFSQCSSFLRPTSNPALAAIFHRANPYKPVSVKEEKVHSLLPTSDSLGTNHRTGRQAQRDDDHRASLFTSSIEATEVQQPFKAAVDCVLNKLEGK